MRFELFVCLRYLKAKRKHGFISLISLISVGGVTVGVAALIVVLAVMTGFTSEFRDKILGINSHVVVQEAGGLLYHQQSIIEQVREITGVRGVTPYIYTQVMLSGGSGGSGAVLRGIDPATAGEVLDLARHLKSGELADLATTPGERRPPGIILGKELAAQLGVGQGDRIKLISASGPLTPMGVLPKIRACQVVGIFETGMYEYDSSLAYLGLTSAQDFLELDDAIHGLEIKVDNIDRADRIALAVQTKLGPSYLVRDWMSMNRNIFSALRLEKTALSVIMTLVMMVAAFNIVSTLTMVVMEKTKDIAILKAMGATAGSIMRIFVYEGLIIGSAGTLLGVMGGLGLCEILGRYQFIKLPDVYPVTTLPVKVLPLDVTLIALAAVIITFAATIYPARQAARIDPAVALRYE